MTKQDHLKILMLLSALESWAFATKEPFPVYLSEQIKEAVGVLSDEILQETRPWDVVFLNDKQ